MFLKLKKFYNFIKLYLYSCLFQITSTLSSWGWMPFKDTWYNLSMWSINKIALTLSNFYDPEVELELYMHGVSDGKCICGDDGDCSI